MDLTFAIAVTTHLGLAGDYNEVHPHIRLDMGGPIAGAYYNSEEKVSFYGGYRFEKDNLFLEVGLATGYSYGSVVPYGRIGYDFENITVFVAPAYEYQPEKQFGAVLGIELKF